MAVNLEAPGNLLAINGVRLSACSAGIYSRRRPDLALIEFEQGSQCAGVFTRNRFSAAPVAVAKRYLQESPPRFFIINAGNANAGTGGRGITDAEAVCESVAILAGCDSGSVLPFSTGVIGKLLPVEKITGSIPGLYKGLDKDNWLDVAQAIMTTDTIAKGVSKRLEIQGQPVTITGIAKGSGMIRPDMATMLAFIASDIQADKQCLAQLLDTAVNRSFNRIIVDGDTSTNDALMLAATGKSGVRIIPGDADCLAFEAALSELCIELGQSIIRDGEGATKFITMDVREGLNEEECLQVAFSIASSPLVKTAFFASDPNWGRILAAVGRAGIEDLELDKVDIYLDDTCLIKNGEISGEYSETAGQAVMRQAEITVLVRLGRGNSATTVWTCDLSHEYVKINAEYRT